MSPTRARDDRGAGSVLAIAMMAVLVTLTVAVAGSPWWQHTGPPRPLPTSQP